MKYLDLAVQTIFFVFGIVMLFVSWGEADWPFAILFAQALLGPWQMISSTVSVIAKTPLHRKKRLHLLLAATYLMVLYACGNMSAVSISGRFFSTLLTVPAWALAIFYYILTWQWVFPRIRRGGNFLPNLLIIHLNKSYMNFTVLSYSIYLPVTILLTIWVARTLFSNGRVFLVEIFHKDEVLADSVNKLLLVGFYLINIGYAVYTLKIMEDIVTTQAVIETLSAKIGWIILILGAMHFFNLFILFSLRKKAQQGVARI